VKPDNIRPIIPALAYVAAEHQVLLTRRTCKRDFTFQSSRMRSMISVGSEEAITNERRRVDFSRCPGAIRVWKGCVDVQNLSLEESGGQVADRVTSRVDHKRKFWRVIPRLGLHPKTATLSMQLWIRSRSLGYLDWLESFTIGTIIISYLNWSILLLLCDQLLCRAFSTPDSPWSTLHL